MNKKILVVGELNADVIVNGLPSLPMLGQEILADGLHVVMGGSSAICAAGLARLGAKVDFLGKVGLDYYGDFAAGQLQQLNVGLEHLIRKENAHTGVTISLTYPRDRAMITYMGCIPHLRLADIETSILPGYTHLHVGSYFLQQELQAGLPELFRQARQAGLTISLDTGHDPDEEWGRSALQELLADVDIFLPNADEACAIAGVGDAETALQKLSNQTKLVVVKCGSSGAMSLDNGQILHGPSFQVKMVDTTGAGDSFDAGFIYAYAICDMPLRKALYFANACGALSTTGFGGTAAQPGREQVEYLLENKTIQ